MTAPNPPRAVSAEDRDRPDEATMLAEIEVEEAARKKSLPRAVPPIPVRGRYFLMECEHCGWVGSSELCGTDMSGDDSDIYCPACDEASLGDDPSEDDAAKFGQALFDRLTAAEADLAAERTAREVAERERDEARADRAALTKALTGLTCNGSEFFIRRGDAYVADADACVSYVRRLRTSSHEARKEAFRHRRAAEADRDRLAEQVAVLTKALEFYANPEVYEPHPHGPAFDQGDISFVARRALHSTEGGTDHGEA